MFRVTPSEIPFPAIGLAEDAPSSLSACFTYRPSVARSAWPIQRGQPSVASPVEPLHITPAQYLLRPGGIACPAQTIPQPSPPQASCSFR